MVTQDTDLCVQGNHEWVAQVSNNTMILETPVFRVLPSSTAFPTMPLTTHIWTPVSLMVRPIYGPTTGQTPQILL
jgi:hypothetical protein